MRGKKREFERARVGLAGVPDDSVKAAGAAVQGVGGVVDGDAILGAIECETPACDAVGVATDGGAEVGFGRVDEGLEVVEAEHDVAGISAAVWREPGDDARAVVGDADFHAATIVEDKKAGLFAADEPLEARWQQAGAGLRDVEGGWHAEILDFGFSILDWEWAGLRVAKYVKTLLFCAIESRCGATEARNGAAASRCRTRRSLASFEEVFCPRIERILTNEKNHSLPTLPIVLIRVNSCNSWQSFHFL